MKYFLIYDSFLFTTHNPSCDEVNRKMEDLKKNGWTNLKFEKGYQHIGKGPDDSDYTYNARIFGRHKASKFDLIVAKKYAKQLIKDAEDYIKKLREAQSNIEIKIKKEQKYIKYYQTKISNIEKAKKNIL